MFGILIQLVLFLLNLFLGIDSFKDAQYAVACIQFGAAGFCLGVLVALIIILTVDGFD